VAVNLRGLCFTDQSEHVRPNAATLKITFELRYTRDLVGATALLRAKRPLHFADD